MPNKKTYLKENIFLLLLLFAIIYATSNLSNTNNTQGDYSAYASPLTRSRNPDNISVRLRNGENPQNNDAILRQFTWLDPKKKQVSTTLHLPKKGLQNEFRKFGLPPGVHQPWMAERMGFKVVGRKNILVNKRIVEKIYSIVDYKKVFHWSLKNFPTLAEELLKSARLPEKTDPLRYLLTFVQQIKYRRPAKYYRSRFINNFFTPIVCLFEQYGDCDTKSLLLAEFICSTSYRQEKTGIVLIRAPGLNHAILTIKRTPYPGMTSLFFHGKGYFVVLESSAVGWAPGFVSQRILQALKSGRFTWIGL